MQKLIEDIDRLKDTEISDTINQRIQEFKSLGLESSEELFKELCFCLLTANYSAEGGIKIQNAIGKEFLFLGESELAARLKILGYRFPNARAHYILEAKKYAYVLKGMLSKDGIKAREWLVENVKGLGYKEASHFLRNIGFENLAILDFHIIDLMVREGLIEKPKTLTKNKYLEMEKVLKGIANKANLSLAELDLYLWYIETGKILK